MGPRISIVLAVTLCVAPAAWANSTGIAGHSGMTGTACSACHGSGLSSVNTNITGPTLLKPGATGTYTLKIETAMMMMYPIAGLDVAASGGSLGVSPSEPNTKLLSGELVHSAPKNTSGFPPTASWTFTWTAPAVLGVYALHGAGLGANGNGKTSSDAQHLDTLNVTVAECQSSADCNDNDICTSDTCSAKQCLHNKITNCCKAAADCDDSNPCTTDVCSGSHLCQHQTVLSCCTTDAQCVDLDACTADSCNLLSNTCDHSKIPGCCTSASQCNDGNKCTTDSCNTSTHLCAHLIIPACCKSNADCADNTVCTTDTCDVATGVCLNAVIAGCCTSAAECDDKNPCTVDTCGATNTCVITPVPNCCTTAASCDDKNPCTTDGCVNSHCVHIPLPGCVTDAGPPKPDGQPGSDGKPPVNDGKPASDSPPPGDRAVTDSSPPAGDGPPPSASSGCCRVSHADAGEAPLVVLLGLVLLLALRRRR
jgi:MYXO-CTERM domain-containing protein